MNLVELLSAAVASAASLSARGVRSKRDIPEDAVEGQITEMCRDLVVQVKQVRRLQEQAEELRVVIREWASQPEANSDLGPT
jgi:hypothetical protein